MDPILDGLVLATSRKSRASKVTALGEVLDRLRRLAPSRDISAAATSALQRDVLRELTKELRSIWQDSRPRPATSQQLRVLLSLIHVSALDVSPGEVGEGDALHLLGERVLHYRRDARKAWRTLFEATASYFEDRGGADQRQLQEALATYRLRSAPSFREDIERLSAHSAENLDLLEPLGRLDFAGATVQIDRASTHALRLAVDDGSLVLVGDPGAGKSGAIHALGRDLIATGRDVVLLAADRITAESLTALMHELSLERGLTDVLANWQGASPAFLLIDALDAVRGEPAANSLRELIYLVSRRAPRWRIVASIRRFDLRYSPDIQDLFRSSKPGGDSASTDPEFAGIRHFRVPLLDDTELASVAAHNKPFSHLLSRAPQALRELLRVPFNLRLVASLLSAGASADELSPIRTQVALLGRYWAYRVLGDDGQADAREMLLRTVCKQMVDSRRLRIARSELRDASVARPLDELLSRQVVSESADRASIAFSHHVLFDYASARLLLRGEGQLIAALEADPALTLVIRPSLVLHFQDLWHCDAKHETFWDAALELQGAAVPETARLLAPTVALAECRRLEDFGRLLRALSSDAAPEHDRAIQILAHTVGALVTWPPQEPGSFWVELLRTLAASPPDTISYPTRALLSFLTERENSLGSDERASLGDSARKVLSRLWADSPADRYAVVFALQGVCRTADADVASSVALLRCGLEPAHIQAVGDAELSWLADELPRFFSLDPAFARDVYVASFRNPITSTDPRPMGTSRIMPLISNRGQDYRMALHRLGESLPQFLSSSPTEATQAVLSVVEAYIEIERSVHPDNEREETFEFLGKTARLCKDYSFIWDSSGVVVSEAHACFLRFAAHLDQLSERGDVETLRRILDIVASENRFAAVWRRLLLLGATHPTTLGQMLRELLRALPILTSRDCSAAAGDLIKALYAALDGADRRRIDTAILRIPEHLADRDHDAVERLRNRLLGCVPGGMIVDPAARDLRKALEAASQIPENRPHGTFSSVTTPYSEEDELAGLGVQVDLPANALLRRLSKPVQTFASTYLNSDPDPEAIGYVFPHLITLREALDHAASDGAQDEQIVQALGHLLAAVSQVAKSVEIASNEELRSFVTDVALAGSAHARPEAEREQDARFDQFPSWGGSTPRVDAACALVRMAGHKAAVSSQVVDALFRLARDPVPAVRFQIAVLVHGLWQADSIVMWRLIDVFAIHEASSAILHRVVSGPLAWLARRAHREVRPRLERIWARLAEVGVAGSAQEAVVELWAAMYVWHNDDESLVALGRVIAELPKTAPGLGRVPFVLRNALTYGATDRSDPRADSIRARAFAVFSLFADQVRGVFISLLTAAAPPQDELKASAQILDHIAAELYFASGAFDDQRQDGTEKKTDAQRRRFFVEAATVLESLSTVPIPSLTHYLLKAAESFIPFDPERVFLLICRVLEAGATSGYQYEGVGADLLVRVVERYLASYPTLFQRSEICRQKLMKVLDIFVKVGWPSARRLTYRLDDVLR